MCTDEVPCTYKQFRALQLKRAMIQANLYPCPG